MTNHKNFKFIDGYTLTDYISDHVKDFTEWYQPVYLGEHQIHCTRFPDWKPMPEWKSTRGQQKWDEYIKPYLPDIKGKIVWDIGCSSGIFSINLSLQGAKKVIGFDRETTVVQPNNKGLPRQDVVQQAYFVKNIHERFYNTTYNNLEFEHMDIDTFDFKQTNCDFFFAATVLYHFGPDRFDEIIKDVSERVPEIFLQANNGHATDLAKTSGVEFNEKLLKKYGYKVKVYERDHVQPLLYGKK